ncbi:hypothetical protein MO767_17505 [Pseudomonas sp. UYIF39]|jgi:hypothetical protein|uniref:hypothetical protein n=1 Tax=unclassified Pseudomonas TaxID=196821 RepID=UPI00249EE7BE|nr:hypothetical protein [Pseudomonas sp. UYIF39]MDI3356132.1 hypothetical protein [Pseudomonas sp. UYIF39]
MRCDYSVLIVGAAILMVPESEDLTTYDDVVNTVLYAQLAANKKTELEPGVSWYDTYMKVLDGIWMWRGKAREDLNLPSESVESAVQWAAAAMSNVGADEGHVTAEVLSKIVNESDINPATNLLRSHMQKVSEKQSIEVPAPAMDVRLLVIVAPTPTSFSSVCIELKTHQLLSSNPLAHLYWGEDVQGIISRRYVRANLSETVYAPVRAQIALKVKDRIETNVATLTLHDDACSTTQPEEIRS